MSSKSWVGSFQGCHINRKYSHFTRGENFHHSGSQTKFKRIFVRDQGFNKNTSYSYNPRNYKRPPLKIWIRIFEFCFFSSLITNLIVFLSRINFQLGKLELVQWPFSYKDLAASSGCCHQYPNFFFKFFCDLTIKRGPWTYSSSNTCR